MNPGTLKGSLGPRKVPLDRERFPWTVKGPLGPRRFPWTGKGSLGPGKVPFAWEPKVHIASEPKVHIALEPEVHMALVPKVHTAADCLRQTLLPAEAAVRGFGQRGWLRVSLACAARVKASFALGRSCCSRKLPVSGLRCNLQICFGLHLADIGKSRPAQVLGSTAGAAGPRAGLQKLSVVLMGPRARDQQNRHVRVSRP